MTSKTPQEEQAPLLRSSKFPRSYNDTEADLRLLEDYLNQRMRLLQNQPSTVSEESWCSSLFPANLRQRSVALRLFPKSPCSVQILLLVLYLATLGYTLLILLGPILLETDWCTLEESRNLKSSRDAAPVDDTGEYENPDYNMDPCRRVRIPQLLWLTLEDCDISRRMLLSVVLGGAIGYERKLADRPAGVRTMGLVSLGACFFTISSMMAFKSSTMGWDSSRVSAALPSGVGFLGGALIWKGNIRMRDGVDRQQVHGLTTAASLWLSAAIGMGAGGALYAVTIYSTVLVILVLRHGPKFYNDDDDDEPSPEESVQDLQNEIPSNSHDSTGDPVEAPRSEWSQHRRRLLQLSIRSTEQQRMRRSCKSVPTFSS